MTQRLSSPSAFHTLVFDKTITNSGYGYHNASGIFIVPKTGLYVFTWTIQLNKNAYHSTELVVSNAIQGAAFLSVSQLEGSVSGTAIVHANLGDDAFVRTKSTYNAGDIYSSAIGRTFFAGWRLS